MMNNRIWGWYGLALLIVVLDQLSKHWVSSHFYYGEVLPVTSFFNLTLVHNTGAAFSFLSDAGGWQRWFFGAVAAVVSVVLVIWMARTPVSQKMLLAALALILGGAVGNLWDRMLLGYVVDFLDVYYQQYHWPAFNIADSAITVGALLLVLDNFLPGVDRNDSRKD